MAGPFYNNIKGTTAGTPGAGAFTPNAASAGFLAWSTVPTGWVGLVRYEDSTDWELSYSYWNGTTLSRAATTQFVSSSTGSGLTLTSAATATMVADANKLGPMPATLPDRGVIAVIGATTTTAIGCAAVTTTGTVAGVSPASTNFLTRQMRSQLTSATTANAQAAWSHSGGWVVSSSTAGVGGWLWSARFGVSQIPTGPRLWAGVTFTSYVGATTDPSSIGTHAAFFGKDSADTNIQLMLNNNAGNATKTDTGIPLAANGWYEATLWSEPGSLTVYALLIRLDTGAVFYKSSSTTAPVTGTAMFPQIVAGLSATTGTAIILHIGHYLVKSTL